MTNEKTVFTIDELFGRPLRHAIRQERQTEWKTDKYSDYKMSDVTDDAVMDLSRMNHTKYDEKGDFVCYGKPKEEEQELEDRKASILSQMNSEV